MGDYRAILDLYKRMRKVTKELHTAIMEKCLSGNAMERAGRRLGVWRDGVLVLDSEDQSCVLMDYAIHNCLENGLSAVDRYVSRNAPAPGSDEQIALDAMRGAYFSLFQVRQVVKGIGAIVYDALRDRESFLADVGLSLTAPIGTAIVSRVFPFQDFLMTGGAALPVDADLLNDIMGILDRRNWSPEYMKRLTREQAADFSGEVIALCMRSQCENELSYQDVGEYESDVTQPIAVGPRVGRNGPCPCGSGKKYKKCCGA